jgi:hypothetical protein
MKLKTKGAADAFATGASIAGIFVLPVLLVLATVAMCSEAKAQQSPQTVIRDSSGRTVGTATRDSQGTTVFRDAGGRTTGTASTTSGGTTTFRDAGGRTTGTATAPRR